MACTTILVGTKASSDGSTMIARNDDSGSGHYTPKKYVIVEPAQQPRTYTTVISHCMVRLPDCPMRYSAVPNALEGEGIWAACGVNAKNVGMTATETITTNERVLGADPLVVYIEAKDGQPEQAGGLGEEDFVTVVLPYISSAREGVLRLGALLEEYGTYETNGIAFSDAHEIWWLETIGGHHWMARKVPDDRVVIAPNQFAMDGFDLEDAFGKKEAHLCSADLREFVRENYLDLNQDGQFNPRAVFGSRRDMDHIYNTPRAWFMGRYLAPKTYRWDGPGADFTPESDDIPWSLKPERKITAEDVKYLLSGHYQGTPYNPYTSQDTGVRGKYRSIGINRTGVTAICQIRPYAPETAKGLEWICFGSTTFDAMLPVYPNVSKMPAYLSRVTLDASTENFYWASRIIGALADPHYAAQIQHIDRYQEAVEAGARRIVLEYDRKIAKQGGTGLAEEANEKLCEMAREETAKALNAVLKTASEKMRNGYNLADN